MKLLVKAGTTSKLVDVFIQDSSSTTGAGLTGLTNASSGLTWYYYREGAGAAVQVTTIDTMTLGTWVTRGFIVVDGTNMPGCYQLGIPDAALATGANSVIMELKGVTNMAPLVLEIQLDPVTITSNVQKNAAGRITFVMTDSVTHARKTGLTVTSTVSLDGAAFGATTNSVTEIGATGVYTLVLAAADTNANDITFLFTAAGADDLVIDRTTQP